LYANSGLTLGVFDLNVADGTLTPKLTDAGAGATLVPQILQFADFDPSHKHLYLGATTGTDHYLYAYAIDPSSGWLTALGASVDGGLGLLSPRGRVINLTVSGDDKYLLTVHNVTRSYSVFNIAADSTIGSEVPQGADGGNNNVGAFVHQVRVDPTGQYVTICDRGNDPATVTTDAGPMTTPEELGHVLVYSFSNGVLTPKQTITFPSGYGPRHLDFHPSKPWVYASVERGNRLIMYTFQNGMLTEKFNVQSVANASDVPDASINATEAVNGQRAGAIKVDPSGQYLWITNRNNLAIPDPGSPLDAGTDAAGGAASDATIADAPAADADAGAVDADADAGEAVTDAAAADAAVAEAGPPPMVFAETGENNIALFSINQTTGEPTFVAAVDAHGIEPRTFAVDPSHKFLIVGNQKKVLRRQGATLTTVLPNLAVFQIAADGRLTFLKSYDQTMGEVWWVGSTTVTAP
jgi:6-phosphogluconolactonase (cycloisomerase 2 family)